MQVCIRQQQQQQLCSSTVRCRLTIASAATADHSCRCIAFKQRKSQQCRLFILQNAVVVLLAAMQ
eukprot:15305-Heterococcus_DN1.PRE.2